MSLTDLGLGPSDLEVLNVFSKTTELIAYRASVGLGNQSLFLWSGSNDLDGDSGCPDYSNDNPWLTGLIFTTI